MTNSWTPQVGAPCVDLRSSQNTFDRDQCGRDTTVKTVTDTLVVTADGERYSRAHLRPISEGRYSSRELVPTYDDRVLCVRGREMLRGLAQLTANLSSINRKDPADIIAALAQISTAAGEDRRALIDLMTRASAARKGTRP